MRIPYLIAVSALIGNSKFVEPKFKWMRYVSSRGTKKNHFLTRTKKSHFRPKKAIVWTHFWLFSGDIGFSSSDSSKLAFLRTARRYGRIALNIVLEVRENMIFISKHIVCYCCTHSQGRERQWNRWIFAGMRLSFFFMKKLLMEHADSQRIFIQE